MIGDDEVGELRRVLAQQHDDIAAHGVVLLEMQNELRDTRACIALLVARIEAGLPIDELRDAAKSARAVLARYAGSSPPEGG